MAEACELCKTGTSKASQSWHRALRRTRRTIGSSIRGVPKRQDGGQVLQGFARFYGRCGAPSGRSLLWGATVREVASDCRVGWLATRQDVKVSQLQTGSCPQALFSLYAALLVSYSCTFPIQFAIIPHSSHFSRSSHSSIFAPRALI